MATAGSWSIEQVDADTIAEVLAAAGVDPPIEQTRWWAAVDAADPERSTAAHLVWRLDGAPVAVATVTLLSTHRVPFFWVRHGPVWLREPSEDDERHLLDLLAEELRGLDHLAIHVRLDLWHALEGTERPTGMISYDRTVVIDTSVDEDASALDDTQLGERLLARFRSRGRRDVRKAVRESGLDCADETARAVEDFTEYHAVMEQTAGRDGFVPWDADFYRTMVAALGPDHCRVFAGRVDGAVVCWSIVTISGRLAARYYAASATSMMRRRVSDRLVLFECVDLARRGVTRYDLMGIGSDVAPQLGGLNEFKLKFVDHDTPVATPRELPLRSTAYKLFEGTRAVVERLRGNQSD